MFHHQITQEDVLMTLLLVPIIAWAVWVLVSLIRHEIKIARGRKRGAAMLRRARETGVLVRVNTVAGVTAVCAEKDFTEAYAQYYQGVQERTLSATTKVVLWVKPTFTFRSSAEVEVPLHTGERMDMDKIVDALVRSATGFGKADVDYRPFCDARDCLVVFDGRLFVPFAGGVPDAKKQEEFYGKTTFAEAASYLLDR